MNRRGFSLAEVVAALLVLEIGVLGTAGLLVLALRVQSERTALERSVVRAAEVADSLAWTGFGAPGEHEASWGVLRWESSGGAGHERELLTVRLEALSAAGRPLLELWAVVPRNDQERGGKGEGS